MEEEVIRQRYVSSNAHDVLPEGALWFQAPQRCLSAMCNVMAVRRRGSSSAQERCVAVGGAPNSAIGSAARTAEGLPVAAN